MQEFVDALREGRIKQGVDYALSNKYGQIRILCHEVYRDRIEEVARVHNIAITEFFTYS